jgi:DNA-binding MarR family transcriptional regulator
MSSQLDRNGLGLSGEDAARLGEDGAVRVRTFRLIVVVAQELRTLMDQLLRADSLTTQQAALITVVDLLGTPSLSQAATALGTTHQNARQLADALERKGFLRISADQADARVRRLSTTAKSESYWRDRSAADQQQVLDWFGDLTPAEAQTLFELLAKVEHRARAALARPATAPDAKPGPRSGHRPALTGRNPSWQRPPLSKTPGSPVLHGVRVVLAPPLRGAALIEDQRGTRAGFLDPAPLPGTVLRLVHPEHLGVEGRPRGHASVPTPTSDHPIRDLARKRGAVGSKGLPHAVQPIRAARRFFIYKPLPGRS